MLGEAGSDIWDDISCELAAADPEVVERAEDAGEGSGQSSKSNSSIIVVLVSRARMPIIGARRVANGSSADGFPIVT